MELVRLTEENLAREHICCAISSDKDPQVAAKKAWLSEQLAQGLSFVKGDVRGKCFIEYIPAEKAWLPLEAAGYMHINCFWISGQHKGRGYANELLAACIGDSRAQGRLGLCLISSPKKMPFLSDPQFLAYKGFRPADSAKPYFTLLYLPFEEDAPAPRFKEHVKEPHSPESGFALYYTHGCPFTAKYAPLLEKLARDRGEPFKLIHIDNREKAQAAPAAWTNYALFYNGRYLGNEILSEKKFLALLDSLCGA